MGTWKQLAALPGPRETATAVFHGGKVYVFGGDATSDGIESYQNNTWIYDPAGNTWTTGANLPTNGLCYAFSTADDGIHVVFIQSGSHYAYDPDTNTWATRTAAPGPGRIQAFNFVDSSGRFYLAGGSRVSGGASTDVYRYDPVTDGWAARAAMPAAFADLVTNGPGALGTDNKVYLGRGSVASTLLVYDPATDAWTTSPVMPDDRAFYPTVSRLPGGTIITLPHRSLPSSGGTSLTRRIDGYTPGVGWEMGVTPDYPGRVHGAAVATEPGGVIYLLGGTYWDANSYSFAVADCWAYKQNEPPTVATLLTLTGGVLVSTAVKNRARHQFNDVNAGDSQSKFLHRHRKVGDTDWITVEVISPNPWYDFPPGSLEPGDYERQVLPYDAVGEPAPAWTPSGFFTAADPPAGPSITYPINGQILDQVEYVEWSIPAQDSYQVRRVADDGAGFPVEGTVYFDTGEVVDTLARKIPLTFTVNNRTEHVQVRIKSGGLWSDWDSVSGAVSYTPPPAPTFTIYPDGPTGSLLLMIATPGPELGDPAAVSVNVYITEPLPNGQVVEQRRATALPITTAWRYWPVVGGWEYDGGRIRVESVAANGTTASST